jgi:holliday junction DNA helicase RuvA
MIGYLKGKIQYADTQKVLLNVQNVGYEITYFNHFAFSDFGTDLELYIVQKYSEYGVNLFGFDTVEQKNIFEILDSIKGVGSKAIFAMMDSLKVMSPSQLQTITLDQLVKVPGVGKSTAQKFLLGLSGKLKKDFVFEDIQDNNLKSKLENDYKGEVDLLIEWGMRKADILSFIKTNKEVLEGKSSQEIIQYVLKNINK